MQFENEHNDPKSEDCSKDSLGLCEAYLLYFDEELGHMPILSCPDENLIKDEKKMQLLKVHSIWFIDIKDEHGLDRIDLEYCDKMYFAKKFRVNSSRVKRRAGLEEHPFETIVLILSLPTELDIFGGALLKKMANMITSNFYDTLSLIIESELAKSEILKTEKLNQTIDRGNLIKKELKQSLQQTCDDYFISIIRKTDPTSIKIQKAISFLALRGVDFSYIKTDEEIDDFSNVRLFEVLKESEHTLEIKKSFKIINIGFLQDSKEVEILIENVSGKTLEDIRVKITYLEDFFEKVILSENIEIWMDEEELIFVFPPIRSTKEYMIQIVQELHKEKLLSHKFELEGSC